MPDRGIAMMKLTLNRERVVVVGKTFEDSYWGYMQFPFLYEMADGRIGLSVHNADDAPHELSLENKIYFVSEDKGNSWHKASKEEIELMGTRLPNGDMLKIYPIGTKPIKGYKESPLHFGNYHIPTDTIPAKESEKEDELPEPLAILTDVFGSYDRVYLQDTLPSKLCEKRFRFRRLKKGEKKTKEEFSEVDWQYRTVKTYSPSVIYDESRKEILLDETGLFSCRKIKIAPDGSLWIATYRHVGADPFTGQYHGCGCAYFLRSTDDGRSWKLMSWIPYTPDPKNPFAYICDGFFEPSIEFVGENRVLCLLRTCSVFGGAPEWGPTYMCKSEDGGLNWSKPEYFADRGALPHLLKLDNGIILAVITRPGIFVYASADGGETWSDKIEVMTDKDRSKLMNHVPERPNFWQWAGSCCNVTIQAIGEDKALIAYSDFYIEDENGIKRKGIKTVVLTAQR